MTIRRFRDSFESYVPVWLRNRPGADTGYRFLWSMIAPLDALMDVALQGVQAPWPGVGTATALPLIGRTRGITRGQTETDDHYATRLRAWLDTWADAGSAEILATQIHEYLGNNPRVRIYARNGFCVTVDTDGTISRLQSAWDWDSTSNPERAGFWSEFWIVVQASEWAVDGTWGDGETWGGTDGFGHDVSAIEVDAVRNLLASWKGAHTRCRAILWTTDMTLYDPATPASLPDGTWGQWGTTGATRSPSREGTTTRYWEPEPVPV